MKSDDKIRVLFCCMGNICRSPLAHGVFERLLEERGLAESFVVDSAGTGGWHVGRPPDTRAQATAKSRGIDISGQRARQVDEGDFLLFDHILVMDRSNLDDLMGVCPPEERHRVRLFMEYAVGRPEDEVPDPYYGGPSGFDRVFDMVEEAARGFLEVVRQQKPG